MLQPNCKSSLDDWLSWMESCHPSEIELGLDRIRKVADNLSIDLSGSTVVTVAGTNGKGSTISYLQSIYLQAGYSVGAFTSPHFLEYNERVKINGRCASDQQLCEVFNRINQARGEIPLTYFEFGTLAALLVFADETPDLVLLEVGLGGRLDAVNIIDADISIVTTVALDHTDWLGDNREDIGFEKAGVFRAGRPAICGDLNPPDSIAKTARELKAKLFQSGQEYSFLEVDNSWHWKGVSSQGLAVEVESIPLPSLPLPNAATALQACQFIPLEVSFEQLKQGISSARLTGRMQKITQTGVNYFLDVAHNPEAAEHLNKQLSQLNGAKWLVLGMLADKDCQSVVRTLESCFERIYLVTLETARGLTGDDLQGFFSEESDTRVKQSVTDAIGEIKTANNVPENVIIAGSFFTVAEAFNELEMDPA